MFRAFCAKFFLLDESAAMAEKAAVPALYPPTLTKKLADEFLFLNEAKLIKSSESSDS